ncbi:MAG: glycosyltransferase family protein [Candidatus Methanoperedens sp.]|nr:glycosyltransferase family protein [Candidatus Methanoperedens sp.]CAG0969978.1 3-deoxy-manno-octulosonate cytidylyltransferase [Methanosarcinales archaeon]
MIVAIIQARMGSTRLPGKVFKDILGKPMLWHIINRLRASKLIERIIIATSDKESDKVILKLAEEVGVEGFAGSEEDVLDRYYHAAKKFEAETIVRITGDCPLIDPQIVDEIIGYYLKNKNILDIVHNGTSYPDGIAETEVFSFAVLEKSWQKARLPSEREHVTSYIWKNPDLFKSATLEYKEDNSFMRFVVDEEKDFMLVTEIFNNLYEKSNIFHYEDILKLLNKKPELIDLNRKTIRNEGYIKSIEKDNRDKLQKENLL